MAEKLPTYGGQALIEGVLMRGTNSLAAAMRLPDGKIFVQTESLKGLYQKGYLKVPFLRGLVILWDSLGLGLRYLTISANHQTGEDEKLERKQSTPATAAAAARPPTSPVAIALLLSRKKSKDKSPPAAFEAFEEEAAATTRDTAAS